METSSKMTQHKLILNYLRNGGTLTTLNARRRVGVLMLPSRISELRSAGYVINDKRVKVMNKALDKLVSVKEYSMAN